MWDACARVFICVCTFAHRHPMVPKGRKAKRMGVYNNNTGGAPKHCVNMDTMEMHCAIMADSMHFSLTGRMG